ncbi:MAG: acyloxyacyl hydrolase [Phycisphaerales bacterium]|nr:acyloxyacyl hydrolase [Planctomycetota bacterium]MBL6997367.1 acyloxyacyl hydrolase [Phycisphaerales bacterium]
MISLFTIPILLVSTPVDYQPIDFVAATSLSFESQPETTDSPLDIQEEEVMSVSPPTWGKKDTWRWNLQAGWAKDVKNSGNTLEVYGVEFEYFVDEDLSLDFGFLGMTVDQDGPNANGLNFTLQLRWHFVAEESWSMFLEGGAGLLRTSDNVPAGGSKFNFTPQAGLGFSFDMGKHNRWLVGVKWHHISNANTYASNPGRDSIMIWTGISFPF